MAPASKNRLSFISPFGPRHEQLIPIDFDTRLLIQPVQVEQSSIISVPDRDGRWESVPLTENQEPSPEHWLQLESRLTRYEIDPDVQNPRLQAVWTEPAEHLLGSLERDANAFVGYSYRVERLVLPTEHAHVRFYDQSLILGFEAAVYRTTPGCFDAIHCVTHGTDVEFVRAYLTKQEVPAPVAEKAFSFMQGRRAWKPERVTKVFYTLPE
jgi:hypothetical protein